MLTLADQISLPATAIRQLEAVVALLQRRLGQALAGVILHGSAATSGFDPARSDLDILAIVTETLTPDDQRALGVGLLAISGAPHPLEFSIVTEHDLARWSHPCAYAFHFSESHRSAFAAGRFSPQAAHDEDLAADFTVAKARGIDLLGAYPRARLPDIPRPGLPGGAARRLRMGSASARRVARLHAGQRLPHPGISADGSAALQK